MSHPDPRIYEYHVKGNERFPNSVLPVLLYKRILKIPCLFAASHVEKIFRQNGWTNNWRSGIYTYDHYHSITHEAIAAVKGQTILLLGGENGKVIKFEKGDVIVIPAGVAHKNLGKEKDVLCVAGYPDGREFDMNYGESGERPAADERIASVPVPSTDPIYGESENGLVHAWGEISAKELT